MGNFPESVELHALYDTTLPAKDLPSDGWTEILPRTKAGPHRRHFFQLENVAGKAYTHVRVTIYPDGGLKRVRLIGKRTEQISKEIGAVGDTEATKVAENEPNIAAETPSSTSLLASESGSSLSTTIPILPLTPEAFATFGQVIQAYNDHNAAPRGTKITPANQGTASKFHKLSLLSSSYPAEAGATTGLSVYRCNPLPDGDEWEVKILERHPFTTQAFIPMGAAGSLGKNGDGLEDAGDGYLVVVVKTGPDDKPNLKTMRAFGASAAQGISYNAGVWRKCILSELFQCCILTSVQISRWLFLRRYVGGCGQHCRELTFGDNTRPWISPALRLRLGMVTRQIARFLNWTIPRERSKSSSATIKARGGRKIAVKSKDSCCCAS